MVKSSIQTIKYFWLLALILVGVITGCSSGHRTIAFIKPPAPLESRFAVQTASYFDRYNEPKANPPFPNNWQFVSENFPIPISYQDAATTAPPGFNLTTETESSVVCWYNADPRTCALSRVAPAAARIHMILRDDIFYNNQTNIIGLTTVETTNVPSFTVEIATRFNTGGSEFQQLTTSEIRKTIAHELGHTIGLGHSPDTRDLMYFMANETQGTNFLNFLTFGDALTLWTTYNSRAISWQHLPAVTFAPSPSPTLSTEKAAIPPRGTVVDIYTRQ